jgi:hypothetical protein
MHLHDMGQRGMGTHSEELQKAATEEERRQLKASGQYKALARVKKREE